MHPLPVAVTFTNPVPGTVDAQNELLTVGQAR
jgi:hypothetical protein